MSLSEQRPIAGASVATIVSAEEGCWIATVLIAREPGQTPIEPDDIEVRLIDASGRALEPLAGPRGQWVEAGGSAGTTASAQYRFAGDSAPHELAISWQRETVRLAVPSNASGED